MHLLTIVSLLSRSQVISFLELHPQLHPTQHDLVAATSHSLEASPTNPIVEIVIEVTCSRSWGNLRSVMPSSLSASAVTSNTNWSTEVNDRSVVKGPSF